MRKRVLKIVSTGYTPEFETVMNHKVSRCQYETSTRFQTHVAVSYPQPLRLDIGLAIEVWLLFPMKFQLLPLSLVTQTSLFEIRTPDITKLPFQDLQYPLNKQQNLYL